MQGQEDLCSYLKSNFEHRNRDQYLQLIRQTISKQEQKPIQQIQPMIEQYAQQYRNFMHNFNFTSNNKANALIEQALNNVHPGLKTKKQCKVVLSIVAKIFCQELIQECVEVKGEFKSMEANQNGKHLSNGDKFVVNGQMVNKRNEKQQIQIDIDVVQQAYRRRLLKRQAF